jgi:hypothetical protein
MDNNFYVGLDDLDRWGACRPARRLFQRLFGVRAGLTRANIAAALDGGLDLTWLAHRLAEDGDVSATALLRFLDTFEDALTEKEEACYRAYHSILAVDDAIALGEAKFGSALGAAMEYSSAYHAARERRVERVFRAFEAMLASAANPEPEAK